MTKVNLAANQAAEKLNKIQTEYETRVDLEEFLTYENKRTDQTPEEKS